MLINFKQSGELRGCRSGKTLSPPALDWLIMHRFVENNSRGSQPTEKRQQAFKVMQSGRDTVPELDDDLEI